MQSTSKTILFFGTENFSLITLRALVDAGFSIGAVITKPDSRKGRGQKIIEPAVKTFANQHGIPVWQPVKLSDIADDITQFDSPVGVLVSFGKIIPQSIINLFDPGIINLHPSLLPKYRGPSPIESAIEHGVSETGISIMQLESKMDAGPVYLQTKVPLNGSETQGSLYETLGTLGAAELTRVLPSILDGSLQPIPQDHAAATYCNLLDKADALIDPAAHTAAQLERTVRAHLSFPKTKCIFDDTTLTITKSHVVTTKNTPLDIECRDGMFLSIDQLQAPSGKTMSAEAFLNGYPA